MRIVFWQNILSPHQLPYIVHLNDDERVDSVVVVVGEVMNNVRINMGWEVKNFPGLDRCKVYINPTDEVIERLLSEMSSDSWHMFSGIRAFHFVFKALKISLKYDLKRAIIVERPFTYFNGCANLKPIFLHRLRFYLLDSKYVSDISKVFAIGNDAVRYYKSLSKHWDVHHFIYCTIDAGFKHSLVKADGIRFLFVGSLSLRKMPMLILEACARMQEEASNYKVDFVGDGEKRGAMEKFISQSAMSNIRLLGKQSIKEIPRIMSEHDVLILSSIYDGWGAVVNEALMQGLYIICSDKCGVKDLLVPERGMVFRSGSVADLFDKMRICISKFENIAQTCQERRKWAMSHISGNVVSSYMVDCLMGENPEAIWRNGYLM